MMETDETVPHLLNASRTLVSEAEYGKLPTYSFLPMVPPEVARSLKSTRHHAKQTHWKRSTDGEIIRNNAIGRQWAGYF